MVEHLTADQEVSGSNPDAPLTLSFTELTSSETGKDHQSLRICTGKELCAGKRLDGYLAVV